MSYLLDTNACIQLLAGTMNPTLRRLQVEIATTEVFMPTIVLFELWYGVHRSNRPKQNSSRAARLLSMGIEPLEFSIQDAEIAGRQHGWSVPRTPASRRDGRSLDMSPIARLSASGLAGSQVGPSVRAKRL